MWTTLALAGALAMTPAQGGDLALANDRLTYGELGPERSSSELAPGDIFFVAFDIQNITVDESGQVAYSMAMEVAKKSGETIYKQEPVNLTNFVPLGGTSLPGRAYVTIPLDQPAGEYTFKLTVTDKGSMKTATLEREFTVTEKQFGIVKLYTSSDVAGELPAPPFGLAGQAVWVHFFVVFFERKADTKQPDVEVEMTIADANGQPTVAKPTILPINSEVPEKDQGMPLRLLIPLNRPGEFTLQLKVTDKVANKTSTETLPITVLAQPGN